MWFLLLSILFVGLTVTELWLLITIGGEIGAGPTIIIIVATGMLGAWLARREGTRTMRELQRLSAQGILPGKPIFDGVAILVGAVLLVTPGFVTDLLGLAFLLPPSRAVIRALGVLWLKRKIEGMQVSTAKNRRVDADWVPPPDKVYDQSFEGSEDRDQGPPEAPES